MPHHRPLRRLLAAGAVLSTALVLPLGAAHADTAPASAPVTTTYDFQQALDSSFASGTPTNPAGVWTFGDGTASLTNVLRDVQDQSNPLFRGSFGWQGNHDDQGASGCGTGTRLCFPFVADLPMVPGTSYGTVGSAPAGARGTTWLHPAADGAPATVTFTSPAAGTLHVDAAAWDRDGLGGDGVDFSVTSSAGAVLAPTLVDAATGTHAAVAGDLVVKAGDTVTAIVAPRANYWNDSTELDLTVTLTTAPACSTTITAITSPLPKASVKSGSTVPVKVRNECGTAVVKPITIALTGTTSTGQPVNVASPASTSKADTRGQLRWSDGQYIYNLSTDGLAPGTYTVVLSGGATATSTFTVTR